MQSIPYNPSLALGNIVDAKVLESVKKLSAAAAPADAAQDALNSLILAKRSLDLTVDELEGMGIDITKVKEASAKMGERVSQAASAYADAMIKSQDDIIKLKTDVVPETVGSSVESPLDFVATKLLQLPLGADTIKMDAQFFSSDDVKAINDYVSSKTDFLGPERSKEMAVAVTKQASGQYDNHEIEGTLVITAGCTHKSADIFYPLVLDPDNAVEAWNATFPAARIKFDEHTVEQEEDRAELGEGEGEGGHAEPALQIVSGVIYGSSFVGMVHILRKDSTDATEKVNDTVAKLGPLVDLGNWFAEKSGNLGADNHFSSAVKDLLSVSTIDCHCSMVCMGVIPAIASKEVQHSVKQFSEDSPKQMRDLLSAQNALSDAQQTVASESEKGRENVQKLSADLAKMSGIMSTLSKLDGAKNRMLDLSSLMTAFDNYVTAAAGGGTTGSGTKSSIGVPVNYFLKRISREHVLRVFRAKYFPKAEGDAEPKPKT